MDVSTYEAGEAVRSPAQSLVKVTIPVTGMTCAACSARVQRALEKTPGVGEASVNLMLANAVVSYDASVVTLDRLVERIRETGYGAELPARTVRRSRSRRRRTGHRRRSSGRCG